MLIAHQSEGQGEPVLLLNGGLMTLIAWEPIARPLAEQYQVIRCDFRGQLLSPGPAPSTLGEHATDVVAVLDALGVSRAHIVGTSFGALVGIVLAADHSSRVFSLVAGTATDRITQKEWEVNLPRLDACKAAADGLADGGRLLDLLIPTTYSKRFRETNQVVLAERRARLTSLPAVYFQGLYDLLALFEGLDLSEFLPRISCRTLVLAAAEDQMFPLDRSCNLMKGIRGAHLEVLDHASHGVFVEEPERVLGVLRRFLAYPR